MGRFLMDQSSKSADIEPTIVLERGTLSDENYWEGLAKRLEKQGFIVLAPASGPRNVGGDTADGRRLATEIDGPVLIFRRRDSRALRTDAPTARRSSTRVHSARRGSTPKRGRGS
jgi:hypothetical protein